MGDALFLQESITVDMGTFKCRAISRQLLPAARMAKASSRRNIRFGRVPYLGTNAVRTRASVGLCWAGNPAEKLEYIFALFGIACTLHRSTVK